MPCCLPMHCCGVAVALRLTKHSAYVECLGEYVILSYLRFNNLRYTSPRTLLTAFMRVKVTANGARTLMPAYRCSRRRPNSGISTAS